MLPSWRRAAAAASAGNSPRATRSSVAISRCVLISSRRSRSRSRIFVYPFAVCGLFAGLGSGENAAHRVDELFPPGPFGHELTAPSGREPVDARPLLLLRQLPRRGDQLLLLETVEGRVEGPGVDLEHIARPGLDRLGDAVAVLR